MADDAAVGMNGAVDVAGYAQFRLSLSVPTSAVARPRVS